MFYPNLFYFTLTPINLKWLTKNLRNLFVENNYFYLQIFIVSDKTNQCHTKSFLFIQIFLLVPISAKGEAWLREGAV